MTTTVPASMTVEGLTAAGVTAQIAAAVTAGNVKISGDVVQSVNSQTAAVATGSTAIPFDDTIPQITEGDQYLSQAITPTSATNILVIDVILNLACTGGGTVMAALFQDLTANAIAVAATLPGAANAVTQVRMSYRMVAGTTSATTFKVRAGAASAMTVNGAASARLFGGAFVSSITVTEIKP